LRLKTTIAAARCEPNFQAREIAVLSCVPLARWRYWIERNMSEDWLHRLRLRSDFLRTCDVRSGVNWYGLWEAHIAPTEEALKAISRNSSVPVFRNVTPARFQKIVANAQMRLVFLLAHHPVGKGGIELGNCFMPWVDVRAALARHQAIALVVCDSGEWMGEILEREWPTAAAAGGPYRFPVPQAVEFVKFWIEEIVQGAGLIAARDRAVSRFYSR
jgi:hypothetical protein